MVSAWLVNLLARDEPGQMSELLALGDSLRDAQQALDGDRLRELSAQRRDLVRAMVTAVKRRAAQDGRAVSLQVEREVEATLQAALADPEAATAVSSGRLVSPLTYAGLGAGEAVAVPLRPGARARESAAATKEQSAERDLPGSPAARPETASRRAARMTEQRQAREAAASSASWTALDDAEQTAASAREAQEVARGRAEQLDRELTEALAEQSRAARAVRDAQRSREAAARAVDAAAKRLARAEERARRLSAAQDSDSA